MARNPARKSPCGPVQGGGCFARELIVGLTGVLNTLSGQIARHWQRTELVDMMGARGQAKF